MVDFRGMLRACLQAAAGCGLVACASHAPAPPSPNAQPTGRRVGEFVWQDLMTDDAEKSRKFYEQLFGWTFDRTDRLGRPARPRVLRRPRRTWRRASDTA